MYREAISEIGRLHQSFNRIYINKRFPRNPLFLTILPFEWNGRRSLRKEEGRTEICAAPSEDIFLTPAPRTDNQRLFY